MSKLFSSYVSDLTKVIASEVVKHNITNKESIGKVGMGINVSTEEHNRGSVGLDSANSALDSALALVLSKEEYSGIASSLTEAQKAAGRFALAMAFDRRAYVENLNKMRGSKIDGAVTVSAEAMGVQDFGNPDIISSDILASMSASDADRNYNVGMGLESYDGQKVNNAIYFSIAFNIAASRQDDFGEAFFPTITIDPLQSGIDVSIEYASVYNEFLRSISGSPDKDKYGKKAVVKSVFDDEIFGANKNRVIPVYRENDNKDMFVSDLRYVNRITGVDIETAPLVFGRAISLLGISATDDMLAKGALDNTDALDRTINLEKVFYKIDAEYFALDTTIIEYSGFVGNPQKHWKDLMLGFDSEHSINISQVKTAQNANSNVWKDLGAKYNDYLVVFELSVGGNANIETSDIEVNVIKFRVKRILDNNGKQLSTTDAAYTEIKAVADKVQPVGYVVEATRTNSNIRTRGVLVTTDKYNYNYSVPFRSGVSALLPTNNSQGTENASDTLANQILLVGLFISNSAVNKLIDTANSMDVAAQNGMLVTGYGNGVARHIVDPYFNKLSFDLNTIVDSQTSTARVEDIRAAILNNIKLEALNMYLKSNYAVALDEYKGNTNIKPTLIIGTDPLIKSIIVQDSNTFALDGTFDVHVVATKNPKMEGKMFMTFGIFDGKRNTDINVFNFGNCIWSPTLSYDIVKTTNNAVSLELHNNPRYLHVIHLPILTEFEITDIARVFSKLPMYRRHILPELQADNIPFAFSGKVAAAQSTVTPPAANQGTDNQTGQGGQTTTKPEENKAPTTDGDKKGTTDTKK